jgi:hypothetical protein
MIHVWLGSSASGALKVGRGVRTGVGFGDELTVGPCAVDPAAHADARARFWADHGGIIEEDGDPAVFGESIVLWATQAWIDTPWRWWALHEVQRRGGQVAWAAPAGDDEAGVGGCTPEGVARATPRPLSADEVAQGARLWDVFCAPSVAGLAAEAEARRVPATWRRAFPRAGPRLSGMDMTLVDAAGESPGRHRLSADEWAAFRPFGTPVVRAMDLARHGLLVRHVVDDYTPWSDHLGRTEAGARAMLGLRSLADAPRFEMGGFAAYDLSDPWVVEDGALVRP